MSGKKSYRPLKGVQMRTRLNELGYPVEGRDEYPDGLLGVIVAMAEEIELLRTELQLHKTAKNRTGDR